MEAPVLQHGVTVVPFGLPPRQGDSQVRQGRARSGLPADAGHAHPAKRLRGEAARRAHPHDLVARDLPSGTDDRCSTPSAGVAPTPMPTATGSHR